MNTIENHHVSKIEPLLPPSWIKKSIPTNSLAQSQVMRTRAEISNILNRKDPRLLVVVGPCSIHDPIAVLDYANRLKTLRHQLNDNLCIVMRAYFEKPRTTVGWKGFINDPHLDNSCDINHGLQQARKLLVDINAMGLPVATEFLDTIIPQYIADLVSWGAIGARTCESQNHRNLASGLSMPIGIKNSTTGNIQAAVDGVKASRHPHSFLGVNDQGLAGIVHTTGNTNSHIILRGGSDTGPNYDAYNIQLASKALEKSKLPLNIMIDCSHGNSQKNHLRQTTVVNAVQQQISTNETSIIGIMLESFLEPGNQSLGDPDTLQYGTSITDACIDWATTEELLTNLAQTIQASNRQSSLAGVEL